MLLAELDRDNKFNSSSSSSSKEGLARRLALTLADLTLPGSTTSSSSSSQSGPRFPVRGGFGRVRVTARLGRLINSSAAIKGSSSAVSVGSTSSSREGTALRAGGGCNSGTGLGFGALISFRAGFLPSESLFFPSGATVD